MGAHSSTRTPLAPSTFRTEFTSVVLPTPGPPVITSTLAATASVSASRWLGARASPVLPSTQGIARAGVDHRPGRAAPGQQAQPLGDGLLGAVEPGQEHASLAVHGVGHQLAVLQLKLERVADQPGPDLDQLGGAAGQLGDGQPAVALSRSLGQAERQPGAHPDHRLLLDAQLGRDLVGGAEADAADVAREAVGVLGDERDRVLAVDLVDAHRPRRADAVGVQEQHDLAYGLLVGPARDDARGPLGADAGDLAQALGLLLDQVEHRVPERADQRAGIDRADAADHAGAQVLLDALQRGRLRGGDARGLELQAVVAVGGPPARGGDELAGADGRRMPHHGHEVALPARLHAQHAEAVLGVVVGHALDQAGQGLSRRRWRAAG